MSRFSVAEWPIVLLALVCVGGCEPPTSFEGKAQFPGGPRGCFQECSRQNMVMGSFVYVGEYSSACACKPKTNAAGPAAENAATRQNAPAAENPTRTENDQDDDQAAVVAAAAGVEVQRRRLAEQARRSQAPLGVIQPR